MSGEQALLSPRRHRYTRSSTASVTQLLSDSCTSFIQRLTTRVRGPSQILDATPLGPRNRLEDKCTISARQRIEKKYRQLALKDLDDASENSLGKYGRSHSNIKATGKRISKLCVDDLVKSEELEPSRSREITSASDKKIDVKNVKKSNRSLKDDRYTSLGSTRTRLEDKYAVVLDKYVKKNPDLQKAESPPNFSLKKSATTANVILVEKAYPFVAHIPREKTPYRTNDSNKSVRTTRNNNNIPNFETRSSSSYYKTRLVQQPCLKLCPVDIDSGLITTVTATTTTTSSTTTTRHSKTSYKKLKEACNVDEAISEREARRKEIASLINKYVMLDEAYNQLNVKNKPKETTIKCTAPPKKTVPKRRLATTVSNQHLVFLLQNHIRFYPGFSQPFSIWIADTYCNLITTTLTNLLEIHITN